MSAFYVCSKRFQGLRRTTLTHWFYLLFVDGRLPRTSLRCKVNREEHAAVAREFRRWVLAGGHKLKGLVRRREAEAGLYDGSRSK